MSRNAFLAAFAIWILGAIPLILIWDRVGSHFVQELSPVLGMAYFGVLLWLCSWMERKLPRD
jgi:hypothetical protein